MKTRGILIKVLKPIIRKDKEKINSQVRELFFRIYFCDILYILYFGILTERGQRRTEKTKLQPDRG